MQSSESSDGNLRLSTSCPTPSSEPWVVMQPKFTRVEGVGIVMQSSAVPLLQLIVEPHGLDSIPISSLTASLSRCLQPRYFSVVWTETCPNKNWICSNSPPAL